MSDSVRLAGLRPSAAVSDLFGVEESCHGCAALVKVTYIDKICVVYFEFEREIHVYVLILYGLAPL